MKITLEVHGLLPFLLGISAGISVGATYMWFRTHNSTQENTDAKKNQTAAKTTGSGQGKIENGAAIQDENSSKNRESLINNSQGNSAPEPSTSRSEEENEKKEVHTTVETLLNQNTNMLMNHSILNLVYWPLCSNQQYANIYWAASTSKTIGAIKNGQFQPDEFTST